MPDSALKPLVIQSAIDRIRAMRGQMPTAPQPEQRSIRGQAFNAMFDMMGGNTDDQAKRTRAIRIADALGGAGRTVADFTPVVGDALAVGDARDAFNRGDYGQASILGGLAAVGMIPMIGDAAKSSLARMTRNEFLGSPRIARAAESSGLIPKALTTVDDASPQQFIGGLKLKMSPDGAAVFDGDNVVASYNFGKNLVVDPKYRRQGIAEELVYQWRTNYPAPAVADSRTPVSQRVQEKVWDRIERERGQAVGNEPFTGYRMAHRPPRPEVGATLDNLENIYGDDIYSPNALRYFGMGSEFRRADTESINAIARARANPDAMVDVFRAVPKEVGDDIIAGDWVSLSKEYAKKHGESALDGNYKILKTKARAADLTTSGDALSEWGYWPQGR